MSNTSSTLNSFIKGVMTLKTIDECYKFFGDICTDAELIKMAERLSIAKLIYEGKTYREILEITDTSNIRIARVKRVLEKEHSALLEVVKRTSK